MGGVTGEQGGMASVGEWLTAAEAAAYLRFPTVDALYQAVHRGQVPVHHLGRRLRFRRSELDTRLKAA
jgi:excisionase family DNA binding protein